LRPVLDGREKLRYMLILMFAQVQHKLLDGALPGLLATDLYAYLASPRRPIPTLAVRPDSYLA